MQLTYSINLLPQQPATSGMIRTGDQFPFFFPPFCYSRFTFNIFPAPSLIFILRSQAINFDKYYSSNEVIPFLCRHSNTASIDAIFFFSLRVEPHSPVVTSRRSIKVESKGSEKKNCSARWPNGGRATSTKRLFMKYSSPLH